MRVGLTVFLAAGLIHASTATLAQAPLVLGWAENALVGKNRTSFRAKLDTGAKSSSINASNVEVSTRNGREWVSFVVVNRKRQRVRLVKPIFRWVRIKRANAKKVKRPVVLLRICLGNHAKLAQVNLSSRKGMNYPLLIGRRFLEDKILVNSQRSFTREPNCRR